MADFIAADDIPWVPAVLMVFAIAGVPATVVVLTADDFPGFPAVAKVSAVVTITNVVDCRFATVTSNVSYVPADVGVPAIGLSDIGLRNPKSTNDYRNQEKTIILSSDKHVLEKEIKMQRTA